MLFNVDMHLATTWPADNGWLWPAGWAGQPAVCLKLCHLNLWVKAVYPPVDEYTDLHTVVNVIGSYFLVAVVLW